MSDKFTAVIDKYVADSKEKLIAIMKNSIQEVVADAQTPVAKGGKMRVDTGFLRWSGTASLNKMPSGVSKGRERVENEVGVLPEYDIDDNASYISSVLAKMKIGDTFYFGWTAWYSLRREIYDGFMESAVSRWQQHVDNQVRRYRK